MNSITTIENLFSIKVLQSIVERTGDLVQHDIVIYNRDGIIIAATQKQRLGLFNEQIKDMVENENEFVFIESSDNENTIKPGINLLIRYERVPIGSVGITGDPKEVKIFGKLIQAFVEQQILYNKREKDKEDRKQLINSFVYSWIFQGAEKKSNTFDLRAISLGIDVNLPRIVCIISAKNDYDLFDAQIQGYIEKQIKNIDKQNIITNFGNELVLLLSLSDISAAEKLMKSIHSSLSARSEHKYAIGIGCVVQPPYDIKLSYEAANLPARYQKTRICPSYSDTIWSFWCHPPLNSASNRCTIIRFAITKAKSRSQKPSTSYRIT